MKRTVSQVENELLVLGCQDGDVEAIEELVARWERPILRHAWRLVGEPDAARDVAQESWLAILRGLRGLDDPTYFRPWAYRIVMRKCADWIRQVQRQREVVEVDQPEAPANSDGADLRRLIRRMPGSSRAVLSLYYVEDLSVAEIAETLSLAEGTVKSRLHTARERLRAAFEGRQKETK